MTAAMTRIKCEACSGTGLYKGFAEAAGTAVVCNKCKGEGYIMGYPTPSNHIFSGRVRKPGITRVATDGGLWMLRAGEPKTISIEEFYAKTGGVPR